MARDIVERLRDRAYSSYRVDTLCEEAANEIERLRSVPPENESYCREAEARARRFSGAYTGTSGTLAADVLRLLAIIKKTPKDHAEMHEHASEVDADWILRGERELKDARSGAAPSVPAITDETHAADRLIADVAVVIKQRRSTYGGPRKHFQRTVEAINAIFGHKLREPLTISDWAQIMILDKLSRNQGDNKTRDTKVDVAGYAACWAECEE
jgi:hypothetical protein